MRKRLTPSAAIALTAVLAGTTMATPAQATPSGYKKIISYGDFSKGPGLYLNGSAGVQDKALRLTSDTKRQAGAAWAHVKVNPDKGFETAFDLSMTGAAGHADGIAFVLQNDGRKGIGGYGGSLGYGGMTHSVAVELDTFKNPADVDNNHVAVVRGGASDAAQPIVASSPIQMFGQPVHVRITYLAATTTLKVRVRAVGAATETKILDTKVDLAAALGHRKALVGFTGGTGEDVSVQEITNWSVKVAR
ncbi:L-type lectin-domain containing protein [Actinoplanes sp. NPDC051494]|uniref:L-type lectin-domain containing protein n=1 Tax=Actinoplanes sp. NPDC051494 TaxID=3363907 RepID=UPI0037B9ECCB